MDKIYIAMSCDKNYVIPTRTAISSIKCSCKEISANIFVFHFGLPLTLIKEIESDSNSKICVKCVFINEELIPDMESEYVTKNTMVRLFLSKFLSKNITKIIWLDGDVIVLNSLKNFYNIDMKNYYYAGYRDYKVGKDDLVRLGMDYDSKYINAGVLLINIYEIRKNKSYESDILDFIVNSKYDLLYLDQDILNKKFSMYGKIKYIDDNNDYNRFVDTVRLRDINKLNISLLHYEGPHNKPWKGCACRHYHVWWKYAWNIVDYRLLYFKVLPKHCIKFVKKIIGKIKIVLGIKKIKKYNF